jgi:hypothetical protein
MAQRYGFSLYFKIVFYKNMSGFTKNEKNFEILRWQSAKNEKMFFDRMKKTYFAKKTGCFCRFFVTFCKKIL